MTKKRLFFIFTPVAIFIMLNMMLAQFSSDRQNASTQFDSEVIDFINQNRIATGLSSLEEDRQMSDECLHWSVWMNRVGQLRHCKGVNECIAYGQTSAIEVVEDWMASNGHRSLILTPGWKRIGVGRYGKYWTMRFEQD